MRRSSARSSTRQRPRIPPTNKAAAEDPTYIVQYAKELKQTILSGQGEQHINTLKWQINNINKMEIEFMAPRISYRETITKVAAANYRHKKQSGGAGQFSQLPPQETVRRCRSVR